MVRTKEVRYVWVCVCVCVWEVRGWGARDRGCRSTKCQRWRQLLTWLPKRPRIGSMGMCCVGVFVSKGNGSELIRHYIAHEANTREDCDVGRAPHMALL